MCLHVYEHTHTHDTVHICQMEVRQQLWESIPLVQRVVSIDGIQVIWLGGKELLSHLAIPLKLFLYNTKYNYYFSL